MAAAERSGVGGASPPATAAARRSTRPRKRICYADDLPVLDAPSAAGAWYSRCLSPDAPFADAHAACWIAQAGHVSADQLLSTGFQQPVLMRPVGSAADTAAALGMRMPPSFGLQLLQQVLGSEHKLPVMDVSSQEAALDMRLGEWVDYMQSEERDSRPLLNVLSLSLSGTPMEQLVSAPSLVYGLDLATQAWPGVAAAANGSAGGGAGHECGSQQDAPSGDTSARRKGSCPRSALLYTLSSPAGCYTDWHVDFGGSAVWYHLVQGMKVFLLAPPAAQNLAAFEGWASSSRQGRTWLGQQLAGVTRVMLQQGDTLLLPPGWPHAVATPADSLAVGGNFLTSAQLAAHVAVYAMEGRLRVPPSCQYPGFKTLLWHAAAHIAARLRATLGSTQEPGGAAAGAVAFDAGAAAPAGGSLRPLHACELAGLPVLLVALQAWLQAERDWYWSGQTAAAASGQAAAKAAAAAASADVPQEVPDAAALVEELRALHQRAVLAAGAAAAERGANSAEQARAGAQFVPVSGGSAAGVAAAPSGGSGTLLLPSAGAGAEPLVPRGQQQQQRHEGCSDGAAAGAAATGLDAGPEAAHETGDAEGWDAEGWDAEGWEAEGWEAEDWEAEGWEAEGAAAGNLEAATGPGPPGTGQQQDELLLPPPSPLLAAGLASAAPRCADAAAGLLSWMKPSSKPLGCSSSGGGSSYADGRLAPAKRRASAGASGSDDSGSDSGSGSSSSSGGSSGADSATSESDDEWGPAVRRRRSSGAGAAAKRAKQQQKAEAKRAKAEARRAKQEARRARAAARLDRRNSEDVQQLQQQQQQQQQQQPESLDSGLMLLDDQQIVASAAAAGAQPRASQQHSAGRLERASSSGASQQHDHRAREGRRRPTAAESAKAAVAAALGRRSMLAGAPRGSAGRPLSDVCSDSDSEGADYRPKQPARDRQQQQQQQQRAQRAPGPEPASQAQAQAPSRMQHARQQRQQLVLRQRQQEDALALGAEMALPLSQLKQQQQYRRLAGPAAVRKAGGSVPGPAAAAVVARPAGFARTQRAPSPSGAAGLPAAAVARATAGGEVVGGSPANTELAALRQLDARVQAAAAAASAELPSPAVTAPQPRPAGHHQPSSSSLAHASRASTAGGGSRLLPGPRLHVPSHARGSSRSSSSLGGSAGASARRPGVAGAARRKALTVPELLAAAQAPVATAAAGTELLARLQQALEKERALQQVISAGGATLKDGGQRLRQQIAALEAAVAAVQPQAQRLQAHEAATTAAAAAATAAAFGARPGDAGGAADNAAARAFRDGEHEQQPATGQPPAAGHQPQPWQPPGSPAARSPAGQVGASEPPATAAGRAPAAPTAASSGGPSGPLPPGDEGERGGSGAGAACNAASAAGLPPPPPGAAGVAVPQQTQQQQQQAAPAAAGQASLPAPGTASELPLPGADAIKLAAAGAGADAPNALHTALGSLQASGVLPGTHARAAAAPTATAAVTGGITSGPAPWAAAGLPGEPLQQALPQPQPPGGDQEQLQWRAQQWHQPAAWQGQQPWQQQQQQQQQPWQQQQQPWQPPPPPWQQQQQQQPWHQQPWQQQQQQPLPPPPQQQLPPWQHQQQHPQPGWHASQAPQLHQPQVLLHADGSQQLVMLAPAAGAAQLPPYAQQQQHTGVRPMMRQQPQLYGRQHHQPPPQRMW